MIISPSPLFPLLSLSLSLLFATLLLPPAHAASCPFNLTLEACSFNADCLGGSAFPIPSAFCAGRSLTDDLLTVCDASSAAFNATDIPQCLCYPTSFRYCTSDFDCPDDTYCGTSPRTGNTICVGCQVLSDPSVPFTPSDPTSTLTSRCPPGQPRAPCGSGYDLCSPTMPCRPGLDCVHVDAAGTPFECSPESTSCNCFSVIDDNGGTRNAVALAGCDPNSTAQDDLCTEERETCAWDVTLQRHICMSCDAVKQYINYILKDTSSITKCENLIPHTRPQPSNFPLSSNGRTLDYCVADAQCSTGRSCVRFADGGGTDVNDVTPCPPLPHAADADFFCFCRSGAAVLPTCRWGSDCERGESCITTTPLGVKDNCVSNRILQTISNDRYNLHGRRMDNGDGAGLTWEQCRFDWHCAGPRRCTAFGETFGGCAGRKACVCHKQTDIECTSDAQCDGGEVCVGYVDGEINSFCIAEKVLTLHPYVKRVGDLDDLAPTPLPSGMYSGLTAEPCLDDGDCVGPRVCVHRSQLTGACEGRRECVCMYPYGGGDEVNGCRYTRMDCPVGEVCAANKGAVPLDKGKKCISERIFDSDPLKEYRRLFGRRHSSPDGNATPDADEDAAESSGAPVAA